MYKIILQLSVLSVRVDKVGRGLQSLQKLARRVLPIYHNIVYAVLASLVLYIYILQYSIRGAGFISTVGRRQPVW